MITQVKMIIMHKDVSVEWHNETGLLAPDQQRKQAH